MVAANTTLPAASDTRRISAQHENGTVSSHTAKDARGLRLMRDCGYTHVTVDGGWLQINVAIRKAELAERLAALTAVLS